MLCSGGRRSEAAVLAGLAEALTSSLDIEVVLERAYPFITTLVPADCGAIGVSWTGAAEDYGWTVVDIPDAFFKSYPEMAPHDFVRRAVARRPNVVLRDEEMLGRREIEANPMYQRAREVGAPIEQVMSVMLHVEQGWQGGLSLYRERRRPFSERERDALQLATPALANAVRNCQLFRRADDWNQALEAMLSQRGSAAVIVSAAGRELGRSGGATRLLERWLSPHECRGPWFRDFLRDGLGRTQGSCGTIAFRTGEDGRVLEVSRVDLPRYGATRAVLLLLRERPGRVAAPVAWRSLLTRRELDVVSGVLRGWDNQLIAEELACARGTVKKHLQNAFDKLGVDSRASLIARAGALATE